MGNTEKCPNAIGCQVLVRESFLGDNTLREFYRTSYCSVNTANGFVMCKRFQTKKELGFCPNFVLPDSDMTIDEIIEKCEE